jgi:hypothetical protein
MSGEGWKTSPFNWDYLFPDLLTTGMHLFHEQLYFFLGLPSQQKHDTLIAQIHSNLVPWWALRPIAE